MLMSQRRSGEAALAYKKIIEANPGCREAWLMLGSLERQAGDLPRAETCYRKALELNPADTSTMYAWCAAATEIKRPPESDALLNELLAEEHTDPEIWFQLAILCSKLGRHAEAVDCIDKAVKGAPRMQKFILGKADILERRGDFEQAFNILKPYLEAERPNVGAVLVFSRFSHIVGLRSECITLLRHLLNNKNITPAARREVTKALSAVEHFHSLS
jgi:tetratricopeptide (TPR) repeat protein